MKTWTTSLSAAVAAVATDPLPHPYNHADLDLDVRSRAREFQQGCRPGQVLAPHQVEYMHCLLQRLDSGAKARVSHLTLSTAWDLAR